MNKHINILNRAMFGRAITLIVFSISFSFSQSLLEVIKGNHRSDKNKARDEYRHPLETLKFFGLKNNMTVVEISPGGGWYQEILGPYLSKEGQYISATYDPDSDEKRTRDRYKTEKDRLSDKKDLYGNALMVALKGASYGESGSADIVLTFRNYHNWVGDSEFEKLRAIFNTLKPGGVLGITDHRSDTTTDEKGYTCEPCMIKDAEAIGFTYIGSSQINSNPNDSKDYPGGVWNLPPTLSENGLSKLILKKRQIELKKIGESDRYTLKFKKPMD
jgi:predicted methyltransferase